MQNWLLSLSFMAKPRPVQILLKKCVIWKGIGASQIRLYMSLILIDQGFSEIDTRVGCFSCLEHALRELVKILVAA
ncbi:hypothetical protein AB3S75_028656 [Citrus x aurantiifolia]